MAHFTITSDAEFSGATVIFSDGTTQVIGSDNANYQAVVSGLLDGSLSDEELLQLISPFELIYRKLTKLSERVSRKGMKLYFDGDPVVNALAKHIIQIMDEGAPEEEWQAYLRFWEKAATNPSQASQDELFRFIDKHGLLLTPDGDAVFYKGVRADYTATRSGYGIVDGVEHENEYLLNHVGSTVEIPRSMVDDNRGVACSVGLHVGDFSYASNHAVKLLTVIVNPRDVVSVPSDENERKIRVCRYFIAEENSTKTKYDGTIKVFEAEDAPAPAEAPVEIPKVDVTTQAVPAQAVVPKAAAAGGSRVAEYEKLIKNGGAGKNLRRYRNKSVTPARRSEFDQAVKNLGLQY